SFAHNPYGDGQACLRIRDALASSSLSGLIVSEIRSSAELKFLQE
ncbi:MAG: hypothetical protein ACI9P7_000033, partial [Candidatus Azotimanducaceae bacterium]